MCGIALLALSISEWTLARNAHACALIDADHRVGKRNELEGP